MAPAPRLLPLLAFVVALVGAMALRAARAVTFDVADYGAVGDGKARDTDAFRRAIQACGKAAGGVVRVPPGKYLLGPIDMVNGMTLHLEAGTVLLFSSDPADYPEVASRWEGIMSKGPHPFIWANGCHDVAITGEGVIDGQGGPWWEEARRNKAALAQAAGVSLTTRKSYEPIGDGRSGDARVRPPMVQFRDCRNVRVEGVTLQNSPFWTLHLLFSDDVTIRSVRFLNPADAPNSDACDIDSCRRVMVEDCFAAVGDDAFCLKSGRDADGRRVNRPTEDVTIRRCTVERAHGGVVIGSETSGGVRRIRFYDCALNGPDNGIRIKSMRGRGGVVEDVRAENIRMQGVDNAVMVTMVYQKTPIETVSDRTPRFRDFHFDNIHVRDAEKAGIIVGLEEMPIENVTLKNLDIVAKEGFNCTRGRDVAFRGVKIRTEVKPALTSQYMENFQVEDWHETTAGPAAAAAPAR